LPAHCFARNPIAGTQDDAELHSLSVPSVEPECASLPGLTCHCPNSCALSAAS
jgi:hypothetical protein